MVFGVKVLLAFLALHRVYSEENSLRHRVVTTWCGSFPGGLGYSSGEFFLCGKNNQEASKKVGSLRGVTIRIGMLEGGDFGYDCHAKRENGELKSTDSYSHYLLTILQEALRFDVTLTGSTSWGYLEGADHTWKGLAELLVSNRTDVVECHWTPTQNLSEIGDYLLPTLETTESFVYLPENLPLTDDVFVAAFSRKLWLFFLLSIFLIVVSFRFSTSMHSKVRPDHEPWSWDEVVLWAVAAISQQSYSRHPRGSSCRTMFLIGYLIAYLFYTGFAAGITSLLALQNHQNQLTFDDVAAMKLHLILHRDEYYLDLDFSENSQQFAYLKIQREEGETLEEIFNDIQQTNYLGFGSTVTLLHYLRKIRDPKERNHYSVVPVPYSVRKKAFLVQKSFPYKRVFNYWLLRLWETGLIDLGSKRYLKIEEAAHFQSTKWFSAGLGNVFSALAFLISGWCVSVVVLLVEIIWKKKRSKTVCREK